MDKDLIKLIGDRILNKGFNPRTGNIMVTTDIKNAEYKKAIEDYILENSGVI